MSKQKDLVQIIRENPGCVAVVDNDCWTLYSKAPEDFGDDEDGEKYEIANSDNVKTLGDGGYGTGKCYGGDVLQALAQIVGIKVTSV